MTLSVPCTVALALVIMAVACSPAAPPESFHGEWKVISAPAPGAGRAAGLQASVGTAVSYQPGRAQFGNDTCSKPIYTRRWLSATAFSEVYLVSAQQLGVTSSDVPIVDVTCASGSLGPGSTFIEKSNTTLLTMGGGIFLQLSRQ